VWSRYNPAPPGTLPWSTAMRHSIIRLLRVIAKLLSELCHVLNCRLYSSRVERRSVYRSHYKFLPNFWGHFMYELLRNATS
jgi:hypothetical protein